MKSRVFVSLLLLMVLVLGLSTAVLAGDTADETFEINIEILQPLEVEVVEDMDFGTVYTGVGEVQTASAGFEATGEGDASFNINFSDDATLTGTASDDEILVDLSGATSAELDGGEATFSVDGSIELEALEDIEAGTYEATETVTISYTN